MFFTVDTPAAAMTKEVCDLFTKCLNLITCGVMMCNYIYVPKFDKGSQNSQSCLHNESESKEETTLDLMFDVKLTHNLVNLNI